MIDGVGSLGKNGRALVRAIDAKGFEYAPPSVLQVFACLPLGIAAKCTGRRTELWAVNLWWSRANDMSVGHGLAPAMPPWQMSQFNGTTHTSCTWRERVEKGVVASD